MNASENATQDIVPVQNSTSSGSPHRLVASPIHTLIVLAVVLGFSFLTAHSDHGHALKHGRLPLYLETMAWEWLLVGFVVYGIRKRGIKLRELIGGRWVKFSDFVVDVAIAVGYWLVAIVVLSSLGYLLGLSHPNAVTEAKKQLSFMSPSSLGELLLFFLVSATAGFCEEILFRGYLQRQFAALTKSATIGLVLQALVFGAAHGYEGGARMLIIGVYGAMFGGLALWRRSLRPGMMAHGAHDAIEGLFLYIAFR